MSWGENYYQAFPNAPSYGGVYVSQSQYQYNYLGQPYTGKTQWGQPYPQELPDNCDEQLIEFLMHSTHQVLYLNPFGAGSDWSAVGKACSHLASSGATPTHLISTSKSREMLTKDLIGYQKPENNPWGLRDVTIPGPARFSTALLSVFPPNCPMHTGEIGYRMVWLVRPYASPIPDVTYP